MAVVSGTPFDVNKQFLQGDQQQSPNAQPIVSSGGAGVGAAGGGQQGVQQQQSSAATATTPSQFTAPVAQSQAGGALVQGVTQQLQQGQSQLGDLYSNFQQAAGPSQTFESVGGADRLEQAIAAGGTDRSIGDIDTLLSGTYSGPMGLDQQGVADISNLYRQAGTQAQALQTGQGLMTALGQQYAGLTPGQLRYEAGLLRRNQDFRNQVNALQPQINDLMSAFEQRQQQASDFAAQRQQQRADIASAGMDYLGQQQSNINDQIAEAMDQYNQREQQIRDMYDNIIQSGGSYDDIAELQQLGGAAESLLGVQQQREAKLKEAQQAYQDVMGQYSDIQDIDPVGLTIGHHGRQQYDLRGIDPSLHGRVIERQKQLEKLFKTTSSHERNVGQEMGKYADVAPLYFGGGIDYTPETQFGDYVTLQQGMDPTRSQLATEEQRARFNALSRLLQSPELLQDPTSPLRQSQVAADLQAIAGDDAMASQDRLEQQRQLADRWGEQVYRARRRFRKKRRLGNLQKLGFDALLNTLIPGGGGHLGRLTGFTDRLYRNSARHGTGQTQSASLS